MKYIVIKMRSEAQFTSCQHERKSICLLKHVVTLLYKNLREKDTVLLKQLPGAQMHAVDVVKQSYSKLLIVLCCFETFILFTCPTNCDEFLKMDWEQRKIEINCFMLSVGTPHPHLWASSCDQHLIFFCCSLVNNSSLVDRLIDSLISSRNFLNV